MIRAHNQFRLATLALFSITSLLPAQFAFQPIQIQYGPYLMVDNRDNPHSESAGSGNLGVTAQTGVRTRRRAAGVTMAPTIFQPVATSTSYLQASTDLYATLDARLFGRTARASEASMHAETRNGTWEEYWDAAAGKWLPRNFVAGDYAMANRLFRVAGMDIELPASAVGMSFDVSRTLTLFSVRSPSLPLGPASVYIQCSAQVQAGYSAAITPGIGGSLTMNGRGYGWVGATASLRVNLGIASASLSQDIQVGGAGCNIGVMVTKSSTTGTHTFWVNPIRLYARAKITIGYDMLSKSYTRTLFDESPYGGYMQTVNL